MFASFFCVEYVQYESFKEPMEKIWMEKET